MVTTNKETILIWYKLGEPGFATKTHGASVDTPFANGDEPIAARVCDYYIHCGGEGMIAVCTSQSQKSPSTWWVGPEFDSAQAAIDYIGRRTVNIKFFKENNWEKVDL